ncbi:MAG: nucleoside hydrolase [Actinobacteria bacterium]|nr:nucleoside hydrolase [Actinomycetota bacterium]
MIDLILDTDIGDDVDDAFALAYAVRHPEIRLRAVTTVWGDVRWRAALALRLLDDLGMRGVPVGAGHAARSDGAAPTTPTHISGDVVLAPGTFDARVDPRPVEDVIWETARDASEPVWLATIGPATNAAAAFRRHPALRERLAGVAMMGGRSAPDALREYNFSSDPAAAVAVCTSGLQVRVGDFLVTRQAQLTTAALPRIRTAPGAGASLAAMLATYLQRNARDWTPMYDPAALSLTLGERFLRLSPTPMTAGVDAGHVRFAAAVQPSRLRLAAAIDAPAFHDHLLQVVGADRPADAGQ